MRSGRWSIQENAGHLLDLEELWQDRLEELLSGAKTLRPADLKNRATHEAGHNSGTIGQVVAAFRSARLTTVARLEALSDADLTRVARHPRLDQPMTVVDLFHFVAEHDDHHLARITEIRRRMGV